MASPPPSHHHLSAPSVSFVRVPGPLELREDEIGGAGDLRNPKGVTDTARNPRVPYGLKNRIPLGKHFWSQPSMLLWEAGCGILLFPEACRAWGSQSDTPLLQMWLSF